MRRFILSAGVASLAIAAASAQECETRTIVGDIRTAADVSVPAVTIRDGVFDSVAVPGTAVRVDPENPCVTVLPGGAVAYPGLHDAHAHLTGIGLREMTLNLDDVTSVAELVERVAEANADAPGEGTLVGRGWIETHYPEGRMPTRDDLDAIVPDRPIILTRADGHALVANSAALDAAGIDDNTPDTAGGRVERDADGRATGVLIDDAMGLVSDLRPKLTPERRREAIVAGAQLYADRGWVAVHNMSAEWVDAEMISELADSGRLPIRVFSYVGPDAQDELIERGVFCTAGDRACVMGVKYYVDGALGSRGALLFEPYTDAPHTKGLMLLHVEETKAAYREAQESGLQIATHAIGDRGNRVILDLYKDVLDEEDRRWRIEHAQIVQPEDIGRFGEQGVIASMQPSHAIGDLYFAPDRLGDERLNGAYAWQSVVEAGGVVVGGSDAPVEVGDPLIELFAATRRTALNGFSADNWHAEEALSSQQALDSFTSAAAYAVFKEDRLGRIEAGYGADLTVFSADPLTSAYGEAKAIMTFVDGERVDDHE